METLGFVNTIVQFKSVSNSTGLKFILPRGQEGAEEVTTETPDLRFALLPVTWPYDTPSGIRGRGIWRLTNRGPGGRNRGDMITGDSRV
jgi:hypothetical protein